MLHSFTAIPIHFILFPHSIAESLFNSVIKKWDEWNEYCQRKQKYFPVSGISEFPKLISRYNRLLLIIDSITDMVTESMIKTCLGFPLRSTNKSIIRGTFS